MLTHCSEINVTFMHVTKQLYQNTKELRGGNKTCQCQERVERDKINHVQVINSSEQCGNFKLLLIT
jgi:hypothetical protein